MLRVYQDCVNEYRALEHKSSEIIRRRRTYIKACANEKFPKEFDEEDFPTKPIGRPSKFNELTYEQLKNKFNDDDIYYIRAYANEKFPDQFKTADFPYKQEFKNKSYEETVNFYNNESDIVKRSNSIRSAHAHHPTEFKEEDFIKKVIQPRNLYKTIPYQVLVDLFNTTTNPVERFKYKKSTARNYPDDFRKEDFIRRNRFSPVP